MINRTFLPRYRIYNKKGRLAWLYNPLRNYRLTKARLKVYTNTDECWYYNIRNNGDIDEKCKSLNELFHKDFPNTYNIRYIEDDPTAWKITELTSLGELDSTTVRCIYQDRYQLVDFDTDELNYKAFNPISIIPQYSYDGSVNLILNDNINIPRLINTRFSATGNDTYEIVDRNGNDDTNIYDSGIQFDIDTALYKKIDKILTIDFIGTVSGGRLLVGNYHFYFKLMDADGNESDFIGQSQLVSLFIGNGIRTAHTGIKNQNSYKSVKFLIKDIDQAYPYVVVYFSRATAENNEQMVVEYKKVNKKYIVSNAGTCSLLITGFENFSDISARDINITYNIVDSVKTHTTLLNRLFFGNVHKADIPYNLLTTLSLQFVPRPVTEEYAADLNLNYTNYGKAKGYSDVKTIYDKVGYWPNEYYRFGIVYIMKSGELSPVFNIRGAIDILPNTVYKKYNLTKNSEGLVENNISYSDTTYLITEHSVGAYLNPRFLKSDNTVMDGIVNVEASRENVKGVVKFHKNLDLGNTFNIIGVEFLILEENTVLDNISRYCKGFFFVRQTRIPTILCQGLSIGIEDTSHIPMIPVNLEAIKSAISNYAKNHIVFNYSKDINKSYNYITEGFLTRYTFKFSKKKSSLWSKIGSAVLIGVGVAILVAASFVTFGGGAIIGGVVAGSLATAGASVTTAMAISFMADMLLAAAIGAVAGFTTMATLGAVDELALSVERIGTDLIYNGWDTKAPDGYYIEEDAENSRNLGDSFNKRMIIKNPDIVSNKGLLCPDYALDLGYYNSIFVGDEHLLIPDQVLPVLRFFTSQQGRHFYIGAYLNVNGYSQPETSKSFLAYESTLTKLVGVPEGTSIAGIDKLLFRSKAGEAEEAYRFLPVGNEYKKTSPTSDASAEDIEAEYRNTKINSDIVRGIFCSYLGCSEDLGTTYLYNIMVPGYAENNILQQLNARAEDNSEFYCISKRYDLTSLDFTDNEILGGDTDLTEWKKANELKIYSGDCYICLVTLRLLRNFNSPSLPYNDEIVRPSTWRENYEPNNPEKQSQINLGDVNAVLLGMWVTFKLRSSKNLNIRTVDDSNVDEVAQSGHSRAYFPLAPMSVEGSYKIPDSSIYNKGFEKSVSEQYQYTVPDVPYIKNWFGTRIMYSDLHTTDAFRNGYRVFRPQSYRDYTREYGTITKLLGVGNSLIAVMEHGILNLQIQPELVTTDSAINYKNILPEIPTVISKDYGSEWLDSIIQTPNGIYGVDTHAKKIWKTDGSTIELISENGILRFLNENLTLGEREKTPILGRRNVKTIYNQYKGDIMFTFYNILDYDEIAWNLCYNEKLQKFITFYSWIPSFMENINNIPFSFDRETSRRNSLFYLLDNTLLLVNITDNTYKIADPVYKGDFIPDSKLFDILVNIESGYDVELKIDSDKKLGKFFTIERNTDVEEGILTKNLICWSLKFASDISELSEDLKIYNVPIVVSINTKDLIDPNTGQHIRNSGYSETKKILVLFMTQKEYASLSESFWLHGRAGIFDKLFKLESFIDTSGELHYKSIPDYEMFKPTYWYGKLHPFEFEFVVADNLEFLKIFDNIQIISNRVLPESFHYEITGDCYDFSEDKANMYYRQESTKYLYNYNGSNISYDPEYTLIKKYGKLHRNKKSADFPKSYYMRLDLLNTIYHNYVENKGDDIISLSPDNIVYGYYKNRTNTKNYEHLGGAEIIWYKLEDEFRICNHVKAVNIDTLSLDDARSVIAANCKYQEDKWVITINPILVCYKNEKESEWVNGEPPIAIYNSPFPSDLTNNVIPESVKAVDNTSWLDDNSIYGRNFGVALNRKEVDVRGRYLKIRIRYKGDLLAIIDFINTIYRLSYA